MISEDNDLRSNEIGSKFVKCKDYCQEFFFSGCVIPLVIIQDLTGIINHMYLIIFRWSDASHISSKGKFQSGGAMIGAEESFCFKSS